MNQETDPTDALDREYATYLRELPAMVAQGHEGEWVLIKGDRIDSFWKRDEEAYEAACDRFGPVPFFIERVQREPPVLRLIVPPIPSRPNGLCGGL